MRNHKIQTLSLLTLFGAAFANFAHAAETRSSFYVELNRDAQKAHTQLQILKNMDLVGVDFNQLRAEVAVTENERAFLTSQGLHVWHQSAPIDANAGALDDYLSPDKVLQALDDLNKKHPTLTRVFEIGKTHRNRPIMAVEISAHLGDTSKPVVLFNAMHHAREVMTTEVVMNIAKVLTEKFGNTQEVSDWLNNYRVILVPQVNVDGNGLVHNGQNMWRKNAYEYNGRVAGVDLNRNYPGYWNYCGGSSGSTSSETYRGPSAGSEPETQAMMNLVASVKPVADISYHSYSQLIIFPFGCSNVNNPSRDLFVSLGKEINAGVRDDNNQTNRYRLGTAPELLYEADGSDLDWQWKEHGVLAYTLEVNASNFQPNYKTWRDVTVTRQEGGWQAVLRRMQKSGFRAEVQSEKTSDVHYALKKKNGTQLVAFDADAPDRLFALRSEHGLLFQITEKGEYELTFYVGKEAVKTMNVTVAEQMLDLGVIQL